MIHTANIISTVYTYIQCCIYGIHTLNLCPCVPLYFKAVSPCQRRSFPIKTRAIKGFQVHPLQNMHTYRYINIYSLEVQQLASENLLSRKERIVFQLSGVCERNPKVYTNNCLVTTVVWVEEGCMHAPFGGRVIP